MLYFQNIYFLLFSTVYLYPYNNRCHCTDHSGFLFGVISSWNISLQELPILISVWVLAVLKMLVNRNIGPLPRAQQRFVTGRWHTIRHNWSGFREVSYCEV